MSQQYPGVSPTQGKVWGDTCTVFSWNGVEAHHLHIKKGGYCSKHHHRSKWNRFLLLSGRLVVRLFEDRLYEDGECDETVLTPGMVTDVPPMMQHQFEALEDCEVIEFYWTETQANDIVRETTGGIRFLEPDMETVRKSRQDVSDGRTTPIEQVISELENRQ